MVYIMINSKKGGAVCQTPGHQIVQIISQKKNGKNSGFLYPIKKKKKVKSTPSNHLVWLLLLGFFSFALMFFTVFSGWDFVSYNLQIKLY